MLHKTGATITKRSRLQTTDHTLPNSQEDGLNTIGTQRPAASINIQRPAASINIQRPIASTTIQRPDHLFPNSQEDGLNTASTTIPSPTTGKLGMSFSVPLSFSFGHLTKKNIIRILKNHIDNNKCRNE